VSPTDAQLLERLERHLREICETAAPPFQEALRSDLVASLWQACGLKVDVDELGDVVAELPGGEGPHVYLVAHLDTVFPAAAEVPGVRVMSEPTMREYPGDGVTYKVMVSMLRDPDGHIVELNRRVYPPLDWD
jgi:hypothetical protein